MSSLLYLRKLKPIADKWFSQDQKKLMEKLTLEPRFPNVLLCKKEVGLFGLENMIFLMRPHQTKM